MCVSLFGLIMFMGSFITLWDNPVKASYEQQLPYVKETGMYCCEADCREAGCCEADYREAGCCVAIIVRLIVMKLLV